jgi:hypothetical protein
VFFFLCKGFGDPLLVPFLPSKPYCNSSLILLDSFWVSAIFSFVTSKSSWNMYQNNLSKTNVEW